MKTRTPSHTLTLRSFRHGGGQALALGNAIILEGIPVRPGTQLAALVMELRCPKDFRVIRPQ